MYDLSMGLLAVGPLSWLIGAGLCVLVGWLISRGEGKR